jgi:hypothetical protein
LRAARVEVAQQEQAKDLLDRPVEDKIVENIVEKTEINATTAS